MARSVGVLTAVLVIALACPAGAAEVTRIASSGDVDNPFDIDFSIRWERSQTRGKITRELVSDTGAGYPPLVEDVTELRLTQVSNVVIPRVAVGLYQDLEFHVEVPYHLGDDTTWRYGFTSGVPVEPVSTIANNGIDANGLPCASLPCPFFPVSPSTTVYHGGKAGDVKAGLAWGIFSDRRDDTKPFWLVGLDVTFPSATLYDPGAGRDGNFLSPNALPAKAGPVGRKAWQFDFSTALSKRLGAIDPYFRAHLVAMRQSNDTASNCDHAAELAAASPAQMTSVAATNCTLKRWKEDAGARLPFVAGVSFGSEFIPYEDLASSQKVTLDLRLSADYTSSSRWYNELTDATGKLLFTEPYVTVAARLGVVVQASENLGIQASASLGTQTPHFLTGESLGTSDASGTSPDQNPNFDWRYDAPGRRFRLTEVNTFSLQAAGFLRF
jgi:hypothetical protein